MVNPSRKIKLTPVQSEAYLDFVNSRVFVDSFSGGTDALRLIIRLKQLCIHPALIEENIASFETGMIETSGKLVFVAEVLKEL